MEWFVCGMCLGCVEPQKRGPKASPMTTPHRQGCPLLHIPSTRLILTPQPSSWLQHRQVPQAQERAHCQESQLKIHKTLLPSRAAGCFFPQCTTGPPPSFPDFSFHLPIHELDTSRTAWDPCCKTIAHECCVPKNTFSLFYNHQPRCTLTLPCPAWEPIVNLPRVLLRFGALWVCIVPGSGRYIPRALK